MRDKVFLPEFRSLPSGPMFMGAFRYFQGESWHCVREDGKPRMFPCERTAREAAKDVLVKTLNPHIFSQPSAISEDDKLGVREWLAKRATPFLRNKSGKRVVVERKRRLA